jgi:hypothetical protein
MRLTSILLLLAAAACGLEHIVVYSERGRFGGWPANHGAWSWGNEMLVGFSAAYHQRKEPGRHQYDNTKPEEPRLARSLDGGATWTIETPPSLRPPEQGGVPESDLAEPMDFTAPGFVLTIRFIDNNRGPSRFWYSYDKGKSWRGAFRFPQIEGQGIAARTDYIVNGKRDALVFLTGAKRNGREGRPLCVRTTDGGLTWRIVSWIGPEPEGFAIMPSTLRLSKAELLTAVRVKQDQQHDWIDLYRSSDDAASWSYAGRPVPSTGGMSGNPPSMVRLRDGRICLTYGYRGKPYGIRARISRDSGKTWGAEIVLRGDAGAWDTGYPRTLLRPDGKLLTVYYFAPDVHSERIIAATIWDPPEE